MSMTGCKKGQASAPMELMIGVVILISSMALVFFVMSQTQDTQCIAEVKSNVRNLESAMLAVAIGSPPTTKEVFFTFKSCGEKNIKTIRITRYEDPKYCRPCPGQYKGCWIIEPIFTTGRENPPNYYTLSDASTCINMPANILIAKSSAPGCSDVELYQNPCGVAVCTPAQAGVTSSMWNPVCTADYIRTHPDEAQVKCKALFMSFTSTRSGNFKFTLTKNVKTTGGESLGQVEICPSKA